MSQPSLSPPIQSPYTRALIAGALAGTTVDLTLFPIDTLKTRLQSLSGFHASGGFRGIYSGVGSAVIGSAPSAALFFVTYEGLKSQLAQWRAGRPDGVPWGPPAEQMVAASAGEIAACAVRVPTEVVKQRAQALQASGSVGAARAIWRLRKEGWGLVGREMYRGWGITVMREVPFTVVQFPLWEGMKAWWGGRRRRRRRRRRDGKVQQVGAGESAVFGSVAGAVAAGLTTPLDVVKTRMMLARERVQVRVLVGEIWRVEGPSAFVAGMGPRVLWISAGGAIFLGSYQWAYNIMSET